MAMTRAQSNKAVRQKALREQLAAQGHAQHIKASIKKIDELAMTGVDLQRQADETEDKEKRSQLIAQVKEDVLIAKMRVDMIAKTIQPNLSLLSKYLSDETHEGDEQESKDGIEQVAEALNNIAEKLPV